MNALKSRGRKPTLIALVVSGLLACSSLAVASTETTTPLAESVTITKNVLLDWPVRSATDLPDAIAFNFYAQEGDTEPMESQIFYRGEYTVFFEFGKSDGLSFGQAASFSADATLPNTGEFWVELVADGRVLGERSHVMRDAEQLTLGDSGTGSFTSGSGSSDTQISTTSSSSSTTVIGPTADGTMPDWQSNGSGDLYFTYNDRRVGVGTTAPTARLDVIASVPGDGTAITGYSSNSPGFRLRSGTTGAFAQNLMVLGNSAGFGGTLVGDYALRNAGGGSIVFGLSSTAAGTSYERMRLTNDGKLGLNVSTPASTLDILNSAAGDGIRISGAGSNAPAFRLANDTVGFAQNLLALGASNGFAGTQIGDYVVRVATGGDMVFGFSSAANGTSTERLRITSEGYVGIGTSVPTRALEVNGTIRSKELIVENVNWPDYVFADDYKLMPLEQLAGYIEENNHLPGVPSAAEVHEGGFQVSEVTAALLQKVEEFSLHMIELKRENERLAARVQELEAAQVK